MKRFLIGLFIFSSVLIMASAASAAPRTWTLDLAASVDSAEVSTSSVVQTSRCSNLVFFLAYEGDSATVTIQGSDDQSTWYTLSTFITNGADGTQAIQYYGPVVQLGVTSATKGALTEFEVPPMTYTRVSLLNHDKAGDDVISGISAKLRCNP
jgi:hypothetical protein